MEAQLMEVHVVRVPQMIQELHLHSLHENVLKSCAKWR